MSRIMTYLRDAVESIKEHHAGKITLRTSTVQKAKPIPMTGSHVRRIRAHLNMSQEVFARCLHTPPGAHWRSRSRVSPSPRGPQPPC